MLCDRLTIFIVIDECPQDALSQLNTREVGHGGTTNGITPHSAKKPELSPKPREVSPKPEVMFDHQFFCVGQILTVAFQGQPVRKPPRQLDGYVGFANLPNQVHHFFQCMEHVPMGRIDSLLQLIPNLLCAGVQKICEEGFRVHPDGGWRDWPWQKHPHQLHVLDGHLLGGPSGTKSKTEEDRPGHCRYLVDE